MIVGLNVAAVTIWLMTKDTAMPELPGRGVWFTDLNRTAS